jgi:HK97 family phage portal protein
VTVVVSGGRNVGVGRPRAGWPLRGLEYEQDHYPRSGVWDEQFSFSHSYTHIYKSQPWIFVLANKLARGIGRLPLKSYSLDLDTGERDRLRRHPLPILLSRPYPRGSRFRLVEHTIGSLAVFGNALWWKYRPSPGRAPVELWPLDWRRIVIRTGDTAPVEHFEYWASGGKVVMLPDDVVHFQFWSPEGITGTSPLEPLRSTLAIETAGREYAAASFRNAIRPSGALVSERGLNDTQKKELRKQIEATHSGTANAFRMMLLTGGLTWQTFSHTAEEGQTVEQRKLNQIEACAVYDIPPPLVAILDNATFSNITEQAKILYRDTFGPWLGLVEDTLGAQLLWGEPEFGESFCEFDLGEVLRADIDVRGTAYERMRSVRTPNEMRDLENLPRIDDPGADTIYVPLNYEGVGLEPQPTAPEQPAPARVPADRRQ